MEDISKLLKEAKPLYFARKRRNNRIKATLAMLICAAGIGMFYPETDNIQYSYGSYFDYIETVYSDNGSVIEDMGLPTDEYGLLMVG